MKISSIKQLWSRAPHNAFTDLVQFNQRLICCFREATNHVSPDGKIRLLYLETNLKIQSHQFISLPHCDLRDPKLSIDPKGNLILLAYARFSSQSDYGAMTTPICWVAKDGKTFGAPKFIGDRYWWLWRIRWHENKHLCGQGQKTHTAYGFGYNRAQEELKLFAGIPRQTFEVIQDEACSKSKHGLGYPNESDILFHDNTAFALIRRDADSCSAQLGVANYPFKDWKWHDLKAYIGGPVMCWKDEHTILIAGRVWLNRQFKTAMLSLSLQTKKLRLETLLPSGGDCSYPGIVKDGDTIFVSYYSSHQNNKSNIYLAEVNV